MYAKNKLYQYWRIYLWTKSKVIVQKKQATVKKTGKIISNTKVEMDDFEIIKTIG